MSVSPDVMTLRHPQPATVLELVKPITWFPPMWASCAGWSRPERPSPSAVRLSRLACCWPTLRHEPGRERLVRPSDPLDRRERFVTICRDVDVQRLTFEAYTNKRLVRALRSHISASC